MTTTSTFPNAVNTVLRELVERRKLPLTYHEWVDKNPETGEHEGHLFVVDNLYYYYFKWEKNNYRSVYQEVNFQYKDEVMESGSNARTFSQEKFQFYKHTVGIFSILFGDRTQPVIYQVTNSIMEDKGFKIVQKYNKEPVWVIEDKYMQTFTTGDTEDETKTDNDDSSTESTFKHDIAPKKDIEDASVVEEKAPEPQPEPEQQKTDVNIDEPPDDYEPSEEEQSKMEDFF